MVGPVPQLRRQAQLCGLRSVNPYHFQKVGVSLARYCLENYLQNKYRAYTAHY